MLWSSTVDVRVRLYAYLLLAKSCMMSDKIKELSWREVILRVRSRYERSGNEKPPGMMAMHAHWTMSFSGSKMAALAHDALSAISRMTPSWDRSICICWTRSMSVFQPSASVATWVSWAQLLLAFGRSIVTQLIFLDDCKVPHAFCSYVWFHISVQGYQGQLVRDYGNCKDSAVSKSLI